MSPAHLYLRARLCLHAGNDLDHAAALLYDWGVPQAVPPPVGCAPAAAAASPTEVDEGLVASLREAVGGAGPSCRREASAPGRYTTFCAQNPVSVGC